MVEEDFPSSPLPFAELPLVASSKIHSKDLHRPLCTSVSSSSPVFKSTFSGSFVSSISFFVSSAGFEREKLIELGFPNRLLLGLPFAAAFDPNVKPDELPEPDDEPKPDDFPLVPTLAKPKPEDPFPKPLPVDLDAAPNPLLEDDPDAAPKPEEEPNPNPVLGFSVDEANDVEANGLLLALAGAASFFSSEPSLSVAVVVSAGFEAPKSRLTL